MRVSGWMYLVQQFLGAASLLLSLGLTARLGRIIPWRMLLTALLCALGCILSAQEPVLRWMMLPLALLSPLAAWPGIPRRMRPRLMLLLGTMALTLSGCARLTASLPLARLLQMPLCCGGLLLCPLLLRPGNAPRCVSIAIRRGAHRITLTALVDSGNLLRDPLTALPVIVISRRAAARLIPLPQPGGLTPGMRLMRIRTVAGTSMMTIFRPGSVHLSSGGAWREVKALIGLCPDGYEGFQALVPASLTGAWSSHPTTTLIKEDISP